MTEVLVEYKKWLGAETRTHEFGGTKVYSKEFLSSSTQQPGSEKVNCGSNQELGFSYTDDTKEHEFEESEHFGKRIVEVINWDIQGRNRG